MNEKRGRGRPKISKIMYGDNAKHFEAVITDGKSYRAQRSKTDMLYAIKGISVIMEAVSEIEHLELIFDDKRNYMCRSIMNQLGRMHITEGYDEENVIVVAKVAAQMRKDGLSVKEIEKYILNGRLTGEW